MPDLVGGAGIGRVDLATAPQRHEARRGPDGSSALNGSIEYFDEHDNVVDNQDIFWFINHYVRHCEANGLAIDDSLFR